MTGQCVGSHKVCKSVVVPGEGVMGLGRALNTQPGECSAQGGPCISVLDCLVGEMRSAV